MNFLAFEKRKTKRCRVGSYRSLSVEFIKLNSVVKDKICLECVVSKFTANNTLKDVLVTKENLESDLNTISDFTRDKKYVNIY